jgi:hypothetical protein
MSARLQRLCLRVEASSGMFPALEGPGHVLDRICRLRWPIWLYIKLRMIRPCRPVNKMPGGSVATVRFLTGMERVKWTAKADESIGRAGARVGSANAAQQPKLGRDDGPDL